MEAVEKACPSWSWEVAVVAEAHGLHPAEVRSWSLWRVTEALYHVLIRRTVDNI